MLSERKVEIHEKLAEILEENPFKPVYPRNSDQNKVHFF